jgi:hypothetical protein
VTGPTRTDSPTQDLAEVRRSGEAGDGSAPDARRSASRWSRLKAAGPAYWILAVLILVGVAVRIVAFTAWWPASTTLADATTYSFYAEADPLGDPQHPVGYPALLALLGFVTRELAVTIVIQHLLAIASALILFGAVRRVVGSPWPALVPAAIVLLNADLVFLEHTIMSESWFLAATAGGLYATVRAIDTPAPWWRWPAAAAALIVLAALIRSSAVFLLPVAALAILVAQPRPWRPRLPAALSVLGVGLVLLAAYATVNVVANGRFEVGPTQGWHMYGRVAQFADCAQFSPPAGTNQLCEANDPNLRPGGDYYLYVADSPAIRAYGPQPWRRHDDDMGAWARQAIIHQPKTYALTVWRDLRTYFVPSTKPPRPYSGGDLDGELDWTVWYPESAESIRRIGAGMQFFNPFHVTRRTEPLELLHDYQRVFRFGATVLTLATLLTLLGLLVGPARSRAGVLLFGVGGLAMLLGPTLSVYAIGRYSVPLAPLFAAGAAITVWTLSRMESQRRRFQRPA